jgi:hypothetical protein
MKINYDRLVELNREALVGEHQNQLGSFYIVQNGIEKLAYGESLEDIHKELLIELGVIEITEDETPIVKPHKFNTNG